MPILLSKRILDKMRRRVYGGRVSLTFYTVTPADGEREAEQLTDGWTMHQASDEPDTILLLAGDVVTDITMISAGAVAEIVANGRTQRFTVTEVLPMQQFGTGWRLRLTPRTSLSQ